MFMSNEEPKLQLGVSITMDCVLECHVMDW